MFWGQIQLTVIGREMLHSHAPPPPCMGVTMGTLRVDDRGAGGTGDWGKLWEVREEMWSNPFWALMLQYAHWERNVAVTISLGAGNPFEGQ